MIYRPGVGSPISTSLPHYNPLQMCFIHFQTGQFPGTGIYMWRSMSYFNIQTRIPEVKLTGSNNYGFKFL
jgi:hypothetical protein